MPVSLPHPMELLKRKLSDIVEVIPQGSQVVYLDYPVYGNVGDLLIMQGTEAFFLANGIRVRKRYSCLQFRSGMRIPEDWILVCQGGGNFGDLYPNSHRLREKVARDYPNHRIVVLPQTIHFTDKAEQERSLAVFAEHPDFHLYVRDEASYAIASEKLVNVRLCPDMAHQLFPIPSGAAPGERVLAVLRTDTEVSGETPEVAAFDRLTDWPQLLGKRMALLLKLLDKGCSLDRLLGNLLPIQPLWYWLARRLTDKAVRLYRGYGRVVTSRLHGHILACLMGMPNDLLDNAYGKNSGYYRLWTSQVEEASLVAPQRLAAAKEEASIAFGSGNDHRDLYPQSS